MERCLKLSLAAAVVGGGFVVVPVGSSPPA